MDEIEIKDNKPGYEDEHRWYEYPEDSLGDKALLS
jgi:hypothetical protein